MQTMFIKANMKRRGSLLLELLLAISLLAIVLTIGAQAVLVGLRGAQTSGERDVATGLASEALEGTRGALEESWQNIYSLSKSTQHYYATSTFPAGKWTLLAGDEVVVVNNISYTRYITIDNVSRDPTTRAIDPSYITSNDDPSTQKVTVTISWLNGVPITISEYYVRWKNKACSQSSWAGAGGSGSSVQPCGTTTYDTADATISLAGGTLSLVSSTAGGIVTSSVFDSTGAVFGGGYNSILWKGSLGFGPSGAVLFQFAGADAPTGPWNYVGGSTCSSTDWFNPGAPNTSTELKGITCLNSINNKRYFRYRVKLCSVDATCNSWGSYTPTVSGVVVSWAP